MVWRTAFALVGLLLLSGSAVAQSSGANITLQLPAFSQFGVDTTVIVPDGGAASLGGNSAAAMDSRRFGPASPTRSFGAGRRASQAQVTARIHDPEQADAALRAAARAHAGGAQVKASDATVGRMPDGAAAKSVAELSRQRDQDEAARDLHARVLFEKGRRAQQAGQSSLAATYYRTSAAQASPELRKEIGAQQRTLTQALAGSRPTK